MKHSVITSNKSTDIHSSHHSMFSVNMSLLTILTVLALVREVLVLEAVCDEGLWLSVVGSCCVDVSTIESEH